MLYHLSYTLFLLKARKELRAGYGARTRDLLVTNQVLYQLSYPRKELT